MAQPQPAAALRPRTPLASIDPHSASAARAAGRMRDIPGRRPLRPITFDSAL
ncbi:hypothetical protein ACFYRN_19065 [Streptomyces sp. NPDC005227]|uniref:hypothetical protein n=1 Tax=Streptomyces sp. NPDC005227 TaxID=3364707 RepID=UPI0036B18048